MENSKTTEQNNVALDVMQRLILKYSNKHLLFKTYESIILAKT